MALNSWSTPPAARPARSGLLKNLRPTRSSIALWVLSALFAAVGPASGQGASPASSEREGPLSEERVTVRTGSRPVYERGRSVHESSVGKLSGHSVHSPAPSSGDLGLDAMIRQLEGPGLSESDTFDEEPEADAEPVYYEVVADPVHELQGLVQTLREVTPVEVAEPAAANPDGSEPEKKVPPPAPESDIPPAAAEPATPR